MLSRCKASASGAYDYDGTRIRAILAAVLHRDRKCCCAETGVTGEEISDKNIHTDITA